MEKVYGDTDSLTNLHNENFLRSEYQKYLESNFLKANFIMLDFKKFKHINDSYGHDMGDKYLITFARVLSSVFDESLVIRLHGDEFCILTKYNDDEIIKRIELCNKKIDLIVESGSIPEKLYFNAGIVEAKHGIDNTKDMADYMMYYAKNNNSNYQTFDKNIWNIKLDEEQFLKGITHDLNDGNFSYYQRKIHNLDAKFMDISEISTRGSKGISIFNDNNYKLLRENCLLKKIDMYNIEYLLSSITSLVDGKVLINLDYKSLLDKKGLLEYLSMLIDINKINPNSIVLSININGIQPEMYSEIIFLINSLHTLKFNICLDKYSSKTPDSIWENTNVNFVKYDTDYWKSSMHNSKMQSLLLGKVKLFSEYSDVNSIFTCIENEEQYEYLCDMGYRTMQPKKCLISGDHISNEVKIKIK